MLSSRKLRLIFSDRLFQNINGGQSSEFSSKIPEDRDKSTKKTKKITVSARNDFVSHNLNSTISTYWRRQQTIRDYIEEEEKKAQRRSQANEQKKQRNYYSSTMNSEQSLHRNNKDKNQTKSQKYVFNHDRTSQSALIANHDDGYDDDDDDSDSDYFLDKLETPEWGKLDLPKINKDFYKASDITLNRASDVISDFYEKEHVKVEQNSQRPIFQFNELKDLTAEVITALEERGHANCTPIQAQAIPLALSGRNFTGISQSGTGKTLAMILSTMIHNLHQIPVSQTHFNGPIGIILAPTHEMAQQIAQTANEFGVKANVKCSLFSDSSKRMEVGQLLITTPDSLYEVLRSKLLNLHRCSHFALYEADRMIELGLDEEVLEIATQLRPECQRIIWSASSNNDLRALANELLDDYDRLEVGTTAVKLNVPQNVKQIMKMSEEQDKFEVLHEIIDLIKSQADQKTLIFVENQYKSDKIAKTLQTEGYRSASYHYNKSAKEKEKILSEFRNEQIHFLVVTDVAAKNVNFTQIQHVVNYDMPMCISDYVQRISRTGRSANGMGHAYAIVTEDDGHLADDLIAILQQAKQKVDPALFILKAANADSDDDISFAIPEGKGYKTYSIDTKRK